MKQPNVVWIISDEQRADTVPWDRQPCFPELYTPHLTWLQERSAVFPNAYCTSPLCSPARSSILSGLYPHGTGVEANYLPESIGLAGGAALRPDVKLLADYVAPADYVCGYVGKWHLPTGDARRAFLNRVCRIGDKDVEDRSSDDAVQLAGRLGVQLGQPYASHLREKGLAQNPDMDVRTTGRSTLLPLAFHPATMMAHEAAAFLRSMQSEERSFALVYSFIEPHPLGRLSNICPAPFDQLYSPDTVPMPDMRRASDAAFIKRYSHPGRLSDRLEEEGAMTEADVRAFVAGYYNTVSYVDYLVGIIIQALIATDQFDDTLIVFTSDHGDMMGNQGTFKKGPLMFEGVTRVPLLVKPPGPQLQHNLVSELVSHVDLLPTTLDYCGVDSESVLHGCSLRPCIESGAYLERPGIGLEYEAHYTEVDASGRAFYQEPFPMRAWHTRDWKYVETLDGTDELYHLSHDPAEQVNRIDSAEYQEQKRKLQQALHQHLQQTGDAWLTRRAGV